MVSFVLKSIQWIDRSRLFFMHSHILSMFCKDEEIMKNASQCVGRLEAAMDDERHEFSCWSISKFCGGQR